MGRVTKLLLALCLIASLSLAKAWAGIEQDTTTAGGWLRSGCSRGSVGECLANEFELDSESNRRILAARRYISYGALQRNSVPCSRRGASYYNCRPAAQVNPYRRGCSRITRCRT